MERQEERIKKEQKKRKMNKKNTKWTLLLEGNHTKECRIGAGKRTRQ